MPLRHSPPTKASSVSHEDTSVSALPAAEAQAQARVEIHREISAQKILINASDCDLQCMSDDPSNNHYNTSQRQKRKRTNTSEMQISHFMTEMRDMFSDLKAQQETKMEKLYTVIEEVRNQNLEIRSCIEFLSTKYDSLMEQVNELKEENSQHLKYIQALETKLENCERSNRATCIEIKNLPINQSESKGCLLETVSKIGDVLKVGIQTNDVKDIFRINTRNPENKTVIVDLVSNIKKDFILKAYKKYNKGNTKLNTENVGIHGQSKPIFIAENLTAKMKRLFYLARVFANSNEYKYCWTSNGKIFIREKDGSPFYLIKDESDLKKIVKAY
ncbi:unnamed protein product [Chilo suppressalis]|uniref:FP protein C-terminal domain-containing protein n=1 Tax=Chilo suppressalis TaxID=168631 RepID=A0ABN8ARZ0_CHISP|nr:unnamed protein product [Chilo suppressalis]